MQDWLKLLRFHLEPEKIRFYAVGEYGDQSWRPHYHLILFNFDCLHQVDRAFNPRLQHKCLCYNCSLVRTTWKKGRTSVDEFSLESAQYVAGYVTKKMTKAGDLRLKGKPPEFATMSLRPGIGANSLLPILEKMCTDNGADKILVEEDVPMVLRHGKKLLPLGRYLRSKLRALYGFEKNGAKKDWEKEFISRLSELQESYEANPQNADKSFYVSQAETLLQKIKNLETKQKLTRTKEL